MLIAMALNPCLLNEAGKLLYCMYRRVGDGRTYHIAYQMKSEEDSAERIEGINMLLGGLKTAGIISLYTGTRERRS